MSLLTAGFPHNCPKLWTRLSIALYCWLEVWKVPRTEFWGCYCWSRAHNAPRFEKWPLLSQLGCWIGLKLCFRSPHTFSCTSMPRFSFNHHHHDIVNPRKVWAESHMDTHTIWGLTPPIFQTHAMWLGYTIARMEPWWIIKIFPTSLVNQHPLVKAPLLLSKF